MRCENDPLDNILAIAACLALGDGVKMLLKLVDEKEVKQWEGYSEV